MAKARDIPRGRRAKYRRAKIRNFLFTVGPDRVAGGRLGRHHLARDIAVNEIEAWSPVWPQAFDGLRIGHVSDFHLGELITPARARQAVDLLAEQQPDLVACTGDVVDLHHTHARPLLESLVEIGAPLGAALVLGNHDELHCPDTILRLGREVGMIVLHDSAVSIRRNGEPLVVAGISWAHSADACATRVDRTCEGGADLLLAHNPRAFLRAAEIGVPLTLSGHTHGGQIAIRNRPNASLALGHRHRAGLFAHGPSCLFVTTGVGSWFPLRVNCPAEVAMITMRSGRGGGQEAS